MSRLNSLGVSRARQAFRRISVTSLMGATLALGLQTGAQAANFTGFYMFGDSQSDPGNLHQILPWQFNSPYWKGRPSNGPTWAEYLPSILNISNSQTFNLAISGATIGDSDDPFSLLGPYQLGRVAAIPNTALVGLNGGGNTISYALRNGSLKGRDAVDPIVQKLVGDMSTMVSRLYDKGGRTFIVMNQQDLGEASALYGYNPDATALASYATRKYNAALTPAMTALSKTLGAKIIVVDVIGSNDVAKANPARYGITNWDKPCIEWATSKPTGACGTTLNKDGTIDAPGAAKWDGVHMTTFAHQAVAAYTAATLYSVLEGPRTFNYVQQYGLTLGDLANRQIDGRLDELSDLSVTRDQGQASATLRASERHANGLSTFAQISYQTAEFKRDYDNPSQGFDHQTQGNLIGIDYSTDKNSYAGLSLGYLISESKGQDRSAKAKIKAYTASAYGLKRIGRMTYSGSFGSSLYRFEDLQRYTGLSFDPISIGKTEGSGLFASAQASYRRDWGPTRLETFGSVRFQRLMIDHYRESGGETLSMAFGDREASRTLGTIGADLKRTIATAMGTLEPSLSFSVEHDLAQSAKDYSFGFVKGQTFDGTSGEPDRTVGRIGAGLKARFGKGLGLDLKADTTLGGSNGDDRRASAQLSYRF